MQYQNIAIVHGVALPFSEPLTIHPEQPKDPLQTIQGQERIQTTLLQTQELKNTQETSITKESKGRNQDEDSGKQNMTYNIKLVLIDRPEAIADFYTKHSLIGMLINVLRSRRSMSLRELR